MRAYLRTLEPAQAARVLGSRERLDAVMNGGDWEKVTQASVRAAYRLKRVGDNLRPMPHADALPFSGQATIKDEKLTRYALNPDHPVGGSKARVLQSALGITAEHAGDLSAQILKMLPTLPAVENERNKYGRSFTVDVPVAGPKASGMVRTGWLLEKEATAPKLVTLYYLKDRP